MDNVFSALSDPTRRAILSMLSRGDLTAGQIASEFDMTKPSVSHHLAALKGAGLVEATRQGQNVVYSINTTVLQDAIAGFMDLIGTGGHEDGARSDD
jgi:ArsR family transcriptional regulator, arsenate/arsenite/antimonite-responsive transcriptional repressor